MSRVCPSCCLLTPRAAIELVPERVPACIELVPA